LQFIAFLVHFLSYSVRFSSILPRFVLSHLSLNQLNYPEEEAKKKKVLTKNFCRYPYPSNMRVSIFLVSFIASLTYALPKAQEACGQVNPTNSCQKTYKQLMTTRKHLPVTPLQRMVSPVPAVPAC